MAKVIRKTVVLTPVIYERIKAHGEKSGCFGFSEAVRDIVRTVFRLKPTKWEKTTKQRKEATMKVKFTKDWSGPYGVFVKGRVCELSGPMLAAASKDSYVAVIAEESKQAEAPAEMPSKAIQNNTKPSKAKQSIEV